MKKNNRMKKKRIIVYLCARRKIIYICKAKHRKDMTIKSVTYGDRQKWDGKARHRNGNSEYIFSHCLDS